MIDWKFSFCVRVWVVFGFMMKDFWLVYMIVWMLLLSGLVFGWLILYDNLELVVLIVNISI